MRSAVQEDGEVLGCCRRVGLCTVSHSQFQPSFGFLRIMNPHPVVDSGPLRVAGIEFLIGHFAVTRPTPYEANCVFSENNHVLNLRLITFGLGNRCCVWHSFHMAIGRRWTRDELLVALNLYHKLTFGQLHARQPAIAALSEKLERGSNGLAMKLCNFASLDPALKVRGIKGLEGASALDRTVWNEFHSNLNETVPVSEAALRKLFEVDENSDLEVLPKEGIRVRKRPPCGPTEMTANVKLRRGQEYFRDAVLNNFGGRCGVTQLDVRELLIASHILPWGTHPTERLNVRNGLCLSRLHDAAFDRWLISFDEAFRLLLSPRLKSALAQHIVVENFGTYAGEALHLPEDAALPDMKFLAAHRAVFMAKCKGGST